MEFFIQWLLESHDRKLHVCLILASFILLGVPASFAQAPGWWAERGVLAPGATPDDFAVINQGQLKNIAKQAYAEFQAKLPTGAGPGLSAIWASPAASTDDFTAMNIGQVKNLAKPFYDRLQAEGLVKGYPWGPSSDDFALANIGQVKFLFSFVLRTPYATTDTDADGLWDAWEVAYFGGVGVSSVGDPDGDGLSNKAEMLVGSDPHHPATVASPGSLSLVVYSP